MHDIHMRDRRPTDAITVAIWVEKFQSDTARNKQRVGHNLTCSAYWYAYVQTNNEQQKLNNIIAVYDCHKPTILLRHTRHETVAPQQTTGPSSPSNTKLLQWPNGQAYSPMTHLYRFGQKIDHFRPPDVSREGLKFYPWTFFSFFYQYTALSSHAVDGHQMYFGGSVVGKASTIGIDISPIPPQFSQGGVKSAKFGVVFHITQLWAARVWKCSNISEHRNKFIVLAEFGKVGSTHLWVSQSCPTPKIARRERAKLSITHRWITLFRSNFVRSLIVGHPKCCKSSRSRSQRSRSQRDNLCKNSQNYQ